ncbi:methyltransferase [Cellulosimicrobium cellulans]|uniref:methyltransferase n=1 Tax=Cellulosimicrobium cellulans TaxID=1710 RepID=UPI0020972CE5|nr:methyltransferase [Cellulosimicrobium cellulans]MCO7275525.1 peptide chain release factor N(5)-glutamine methyltransferase [Cellulosimicrobium cellulans]
MDRDQLDDLAARLRAAGCVFAEDEAALLAARADDDAHLDALVARRVAGEPLEHVLGYVDFHGLRVAVDPGVFVPRQRTALLVDEAVALGRRAGRLVRLPDGGTGGGAGGVTVGDADGGPGGVTVDDPDGGAGGSAGGVTVDDSDGGLGGGLDGRGAGLAVVVVDVCCGAGALGLATAVGLGGAETVALHASDVDPAAVACAARNVAAVGGSAYEGDLFDPLPPGLRGRVDLLLANVPYVPTAEIPLLPREARDHEAHVALDGGGDGLDVLRRVAAEAPAWLAPGGHLLTESGERQATGAVDVLERAGLRARVVRDEEIGATIVVGTLPAEA